MPVAPDVRSALFLDRDGVVNEERNYVYRIEDFEFVDGIFDLCWSAKLVGMAVVVITNQAGIGRGYYMEAQFHDLTEWMCNRFLEKGVAIDGVYYCPYHPVYGVGKYNADSFDRKPSPGMILQARDELGLRLSDSILIGDKASDIAAAKAAGVGRTVLIAPSASSVSILPLPDLRIETLREAQRRLFGGG